MGKFINLEDAREQEQYDLLEINAEVERSVSQIVAQMHQKIAGRPWKRAEYIKANTDTWIVEGSRLQELREAAGISRYRLAKALGVSPARIARLETGKPVNDAKLLKSAYLLYLGRVVR